MLISFCTVMIMEGKIQTYLSHISAYLPGLRQEFDSSHPLIGTEACLARKVMEMRNQPFKHIFHARIFAKGIDQNHILSDVIDCEVAEGRDFDEGGIHLLSY